MPFAQLVIGPPGAGKSTYCNGMHQFFGAIGRKCSIVNLDPANDKTSYPCALDVRDLVTLEEIMDEDKLGPNGATLYALEELEENYSWLEEGLKELGEDYVLFDCPGQVELFTHHASLRNIFFRIQKLGYRLIVIHLVDSYTLTLPSMYISALLLSLRAMLQLDLPHLNVLTKIDNLSNYADLPFNLDFYTEVQDLSYLLPHLEAESSRLTNSKFGALNQTIIDLVEEFGLVAFETLAVEDKKSMMNLLRAIDRASGYAFGPAEGANDSIWQVAVREGMGVTDVRDVQERWLDEKDEYDALEREEVEEVAKLHEEASKNAMNEAALDDEDEDMENWGPLPDSGVTVRRKE
ncbi:ATP binding protein [Penicillium atrosanguineum]|uniref:GPN-loop GTPase 2 n=1 Tax=Penicillium atrosanguineum TaxID=1132637 RepID=A0A9W9GS39_9EURO|nr:ATP-grasp fold succinyl-CoA synthetase-type [Penicillium atrosanguineum]KAJ5127961.1 ATP binding protein [Penicillium atrosanguineum]KAJ5148173.1 ATP binding protein [Penicillium atrosanguineum]KAJ5313348.1 ATP-grasp fold succinyl-CoA synthetase-type [Penicillium atrosanguineum]KAJ5330443.1 ATP binding protein [Penicillium atrosanguineum]